MSLIALNLEYHVKVTCQIAALDWTRTLTKIIIILKIFNVIEPEIGVLII